MYNENDGYIQVKGLLHLCSKRWSIKGQVLLNLKKRLSRAKAEFTNKIYDGEIQVDKSWVCNTTSIICGENNSFFLAVIGDIKACCTDIKEWVKILLKFFPTSEGDITIQHEDESYLIRGSKVYVMKIREGEIVEELLEPSEFIGYGNGCDKYE